MNQFTMQQLMQLDPETQQWALENGLVEGAQSPVSPNRMAFGPMIPQDQLGLSHNQPQNSNFAGVSNMNTYGGNSYQSPEMQPNAFGGPNTGSPTQVMTNPSPDYQYGGSGADPALGQGYDVTGQESLLDSGAGAGDGMTAGQGHAWGMAGNTVGNMIDTRDKELVGDTQGSQSGYMKGALKGAGTGATIGTMIAPGVGTAWGGAIGAGVGLLGASQGYFDSRTPPQTTTQTVTPMRGAGFGGQATSLFG